jgi:transcriptional repressor NrdR
MLGRIRGVTQDAQPAVGGADSYFPCAFQPERDMRCPHCGNIDDKVIESRTLANGDAIRRRRECVNCGYRFTSYERLEDKQFMVVKRDGRREPFDREKLERGVQRALEKRPVSQMRIESLVNDIEDTAAILSKGNWEIDSSIIGDLVLERLGTIDKVAYIRFASVYRHFENLDEFLQEIQKLGGEQNPQTNPAGIGGNP